MLYIQVKEIVDYTREVDEVISRVFEKFSETAHNKLVAALSEYLGRHYHRLSDNLSKMSKDDYGALMSKHVPYGPQPADFRRIEKLDFDPDAKQEELLDAAVEVDEKLVELFKTILDQPVDMEIKEFFENLIKYEEADEERLKQLKAERYF
jgi:hypothetical protein